MYVFTCEDDAIYIKNNGTLGCRSWGKTYTDVSLLPADEHYTPDLSLYAPTFGASFILVGSFYVVGMGVRSVLRMIR